MQNLILWAAKLQCELNSQPQRVSTVKGRALIWKDGILKAGMGACPFQCGRHSLNSDEPSLPVEAAFPLPSEGIDPVLPEETVMASSKVVALQDDMYFPQDLPQPPRFTSTYN